MSATITMREVSLIEAAHVLRLTPEAVRMRWRRGKLKGRRDDAGRILIELEGDQAEQSEQSPGHDRSGSQASEVVEVLKAQIADLQRRLDTSDQAQAEMRRLLLQSNQQIAELTKRLSLPPPADAPEPVESVSEKSEPSLARRAAWSKWAMFWPWS